MGSAAFLLICSARPPSPLFLRFQEHAAHSRGVDGRLQPLLLLGPAGGAREVLRRVRTAAGRLLCSVSVC